MKQIISVFTITIILFTSCTSSTKKENEQDNSNMAMHQEGDTDQNMSSNMTHDVDTSIRVQKSQTSSLVINTYLELKNALVADDGEKAATAGKQLLNAFKNIDDSDVGQDKISEFNDIITDAKENADHISENKGNIDHQREHFEILSNDMKDLITITGSDRNLFLIFCPMYNNNKGAAWISASNEIKNPYYGSKMLSCGEVQTKILVK